MTNRREFLMKSTMAACAVSFLQPFNAFAGLGINHTALSTTNRLTILHTSNLYGQWSGLGINEQMCGLGGLQNVYKKIIDIRSEGLPFLIVDTGNMTSDSFQTFEDRLHFYKTMYTIGYDAVIPGQSDLIKGSDNFEQLIKESGLNVVGGEEHSFRNKDILPFHIITKGKSRIGIIKAGINSLKTAESSRLNYTAALINKTAVLLKDVHHCTVIVCMLQASRRNSLQLSELSMNIDVMVGSVDNNSIHNTRIIRNKNDEEVILSYAGSKGTMISRIDLTFTDRGEKINTDSKALFIGAKEEGSLAILKNYKLLNA